MYYVLYNQSDSSTRYCIVNQGYFQALFYYLYTVVKTESSMTFWNSIFLNCYFFFKIYPEFE